MQILFIQNCQLEGPGRYAQLLAARDVTLRVCHAYRGDALPDPAPYAAVIVGGTPISVRDAGAYPFLVTQRRYLEALVTRDAPCIGICAGGQTLAKILGGAVRKNSVMEIGAREVTLTPSGQRDPVFAEFPEKFPVFQWHGDTFDPPPGGELLARGVDCPEQAFRCGNVVGWLFHLEVTADAAADWAHAYRDELGPTMTAADVVAGCRAHEREMAALAARLIDNLIGDLNDAALTPALRRTSRSPRPT